MTYAIRHAAVIGSGTMGGAIAAHLANVGLSVDLLDIVPREPTPDEQAKGLTLEAPAVRNRIVQQGWDATLKANPAALYSEDKARRVRIGNLDDDFDRLAAADLIIEVIIENLDIKRDLMARLDEVRHDKAIIATNTSGLPIHDIAAGRSDPFRQHFLGMHFFNPPRYLKLLEVIPHSDTLPAVLDSVIRLGEDELGKGVVICKDTPNFIANRLLSIGGAYELAYAIENGYTVEEVDNLLGPLVGRPKTAVFRLLDLIGMDVMAHVNTNLYDALADDESRELLTDEKVNDLVKTMVEKSWLGNKTGQGFYKTVRTDDGGKDFWSLDFDTLEYTPQKKVRFDSVGQFRKLEPTGARLKAMVEAEDRAGQFIRHAIYNRLAYASRRIPEIADNILAIDNAIRWGFAHEMGPFEEWDALGVAETIDRMEEMDFAVADWVKQMVDQGCESFYQYQDGIAVGYYDMGTGEYLPLAYGPKDIQLGLKMAQGKVVEENDDAAIVDLGDGIALFEWHTKANTITPGMVEMGYRAIERLNADFDGLVVGHKGSMFSAGLNLDLGSIQQQSMERGITPAELIDEMDHLGQQMMLGFRYAPKPIVAAPFDRALGGGAELTMAADRIVAHAELYIGLVEIGAGLIPGWGGCKELLRRIVNPHMHIPNADPLPVLQKVFETIGFATVSRSAEQARELGFLGPCDRIVVNRDHLLAEAKQEALTMYQNGYRPPLPEKIYAAGRDVLTAMKTQLYLMNDAGYLTDHEVLIANKLAWTLCGGDLSEPTWVDEQYILDLERESVVALLQEPKTIERMMHLLQTGKPLRN